MVVIPNPRRGAMETKEPSTLIPEERSSYLDDLKYILKK